MVAILVQCDNAAIPDQVVGTDGDAICLQLNHHGPSANVQLRIQELSDPLSGTLKGRAYDLVRIAAYVYAADQLVSRGGDADAHGDSWRRTFIMCLPVSEPDFWNQSTVCQMLKNALGFVSEDDWSFSFDKSYFPEQLSLETDQREAYERAIRYDPDSVVIFSGGADSLCAAVQLATEHSARPVLVSHRPVPTIDHRQQSLVKLLRSYVPNWYFPHTRFLVNKIKTRERDTAQRTRSFLFSAIGASTASTLGLERVTLADNGIVSLNLPFNDQTIGALSSRSTHPKFIDFFNKLAKHVLPYGPQLANPFWAKTKAEVLKVLEPIKAQPLLQVTNSCSHGGRMPNATPHYGVCSQCIDRRFASTSAGMEEFDLKERYKTDIFREALAGNGLTMATSYVRFAQKVQDMSIEELFLEYSQLGDCIVADDPSPANTAETLGGLVLRHASASLDVMARELASAAHEAVTHTLPSTCLIQLSVERGISILPQPVSVPDVELSEEEEQEAKQRGFKGAFPIHITGKLVNRRSNVIHVGGHEIILPDAQLKLFLRLVVALFETQDGFVPGGNLHGGGLSDEGIYTPDAVEQAVDRLRARLRPALKGLVPTKYIEVQRGKIRLSTHKRFVTADREYLMQHPDEVIRSLAMRLPAN